MGQLENTVLEGTWTRRRASFFIRELRARICESKLNLKLSTDVVRCMNAFNGFLAPPRKLSLLYKLTTPMLDPVANSLLSGDTSSAVLFTHPSSGALCMHLLDLRSQ